MARVRYLQRHDAPASEAAIFDRLERDRARPTANLFLALAHAPRVLDKFLSYADALRHETQLKPHLRELAILVVGDVCECEYEFEHHRSHALKAGVREEQLAEIGDFATSPSFSEEERAVMQFARESTLEIRVADPTWADLERFLDQRSIVELLLNIGWYNSGVRFMEAIRIDLEDRYRRP